MDSLSDKPSTLGTLILNYGDPAYKFPKRPNLPINPSEDIFLRIISYLPFAETIVLPGRHLLDGQNAFEAGKLARTLLQQGILVPERRSGPGSFEDVARARKLGATELSRAEFLDLNAKNVREFHWDDLSSTYRATLLADLGPEGAFRRIVTGGIRGNLKKGLDAALKIYTKSGAVTPEGFIAAVEQGCGPATSFARRWAMAHYYLTPTKFDDINIRQVPKEAADLLIKGRAIDRSLRPTESLAPAEHLVQELFVGVQIDQVSRYAEAYCEAALRVREDVPEARALFRSIVSKAKMREVGDEVSLAMTKELNRQLRRRFIDQPAYSIGIDLASAAAGGAAGLLLGAYEAVALSLGAVGATVGIKTAVKQRYDEKHRPWRLAIDSFKSRLEKRLP